MEDLEVAKCDLKLGRKKSASLCLYRAWCFNVIKHLNSERAIAVNIQIMRVFTKIRTLIKNNDELLKMLNELEKKGNERDQKISIIFQYINKLEQENKLKNEQFKRNRIGYK